MKNQQMINKCLFPAAGYGTRFLPATKAVPKEMLPLLTKPLLQYGVEEAISCGLNDIVVITGKGKRAIKDHFGDSIGFEINSKKFSNNAHLSELNLLIEKASFNYAIQSKMLGLGDAIKTGQKLIGENPFGVILADDICDSEGKNVMHQLIQVFNRYKCSVIAVSEVPYRDTEKYGIINGTLINSSGALYRVNEMIEKPNINSAPSNMAIIGRYILTPDIFSLLEKIKPGINNEIQLTDALNLQAKEGKVIALKFEGRRFDCGSIKGYLRATNYFAKKLNINY